MKLANESTGTATPKFDSSYRRCSYCSNPMLLVECKPAYVGTNSNVYRCSRCSNVEKVTTVTRAWLMACSKELQPPT